jgi:hypothetical protein
VPHKGSRHNPGQEHVMSLWKCMELI